MTVTETTVPPEAIEHLREVQAAQDRADAERTAKAGALVAARFAAERRHIVPPEIDAALAESAAARRLPEDAPIEDRLARYAAQRARAAELGVDLVALDRLRAAFAAEAERAAAPQTAGALDLARRPGERRAPVPSDAKVDYNGSWDPGPTWYSTDQSNFSVWNADTYFDTVTNRAGNHIQFRQRATDDNDSCAMSWRNGYMVLYTPPALRNLIIDVDLVPQISRFFVDTDNEPGSSACNVQLHQLLHVEVYSSWADAVPQETTAGILSSTGTSNPEAWIDSEAFPPWSLWTGTVTTQRSYPPGHTLAIFVAIRNQASGIKLDDTRLTAGVNAAWYMDAINVRPTF
ncbi:hypothetical protein [Actinomadura parmotrematis]|uniref:DNRLRE domain-containing protein n=1 Tax=Actinomadura parmotrematis TaxID=2864039 RepID=A0ABS7FPK9_9ACTN|nr:hypothetical protein [Actinomadura parmotrematis]MBW8482155.1 hypothetical protein [Actinomadura parmotrematis]